MTILRRPLSTNAQTERHTPGEARRGGSPCSTSRAWAIRRLRTYHLVHRLHPVTPCRTASRVDSDDPRRSSRLVLRRLGGDRVSETQTEGFDELQYLATYFDSVEINTTFYRPATAQTAGRWVERVSDNLAFRFTAKLWKRFTHERKTAWSRDEVKEARAGLDVLYGGGRLGAVLLQFPWSFRNDEANRGWLEDVIAAFRDLPLVVEVRHASWVEASFFTDLKARGVGFVNIDQPQFSDSVAPSAVGTSSVGYIRVHGRNYREWWRKAASSHARYDYLYTPAELRPWAARAREVEDEPETEDVYVVMNNHYRGKAVANALMIESMVRGRRVAAPPPLLDEYGDELRKFVRGAGGKKLKKAG